MRRYPSVRNCVIAARYVLLPVQAEFYALEGLGQLLETMKLVRKNMNPTLDLIGVLPTMVDGRTTLSGQVHEEIKKHFPGKVFKTVIPRNIRLAEAPSHGVPYDQKIIDAMNDEIAVYGRYVYQQEAKNTPNPAAATD